MGLFPWDLFLKSGLLGTQVQGLSNHRLARIS